LIAIYKSHYVMRVCEVPNYFSLNTSVLYVLHFRDECKPLIGKFPCLFILPYLCRGLAKIIDDNARSSGLLNKKTPTFLKPLSVDVTSESNAVLYVKTS
jgi:hypothetical protein